MTISFGRFGFIRKFRVKSVSILAVSLSLHQLQVHSINYPRFIFTEWHFSTVPPKNPNYYCTVFQRQKMATIVFWFIPHTNWMFFWIIQLSCFSPDIYLGKKYIYILKHKQNVENYNRNIPSNFPAKLCINAFSGIFTSRSSRLFPI